MVSHGVRPRTRVPAGIAGCGGGSSAPASKPAANVTTKASFGDVLRGAPAEISRATYGRADCERF